MLLYLFHLLININYYIIALLISSRRVDGKDPAFFLSRKRERPKRCVGKN